MKNKKLKNNLVKIDPELERTFRQRIVATFEVAIKREREAYYIENRLESGTYIFFAKDKSDTAVKKFCFALISYLKKHNLSIKNLEQSLKIEDHKISVLPMNDSNPVERSYDDIQIIQASDYPEEKAEEPENE